MFQEYKNNGNAFSDTPHKAVDIEDAICLISTLKSLKTSTPFFNGAFHFVASCYDFSERVREEGSR